MPMPAPSPVSKRVLACLALFQLASRCRGHSFLHAGRVTEKDADAAIQAELATTHPRLEAERLAELKEALRSTFVSLPKDGAGNLGHSAVRYVLHRLFIERHGWFIKGLEPNSDVHAASGRPQSQDSEAERDKHKEKEWVPSFLQEHLEQRLGGRGASLDELAALAAAVEDLVHHESVGRLRTAYDIHKLGYAEVLDEDQLVEVATTFYVAYLMAGNFSVATVTELNKKKAIFAHKYSGWAEAEEWLGDTLKKYVDKGNGRFNFSTVTRMVDEIGDKYHEFNDIECRALKKMLLGIEGKKAGRVRLSQFYKKSLYSHWRLTEKADYLRTLGALDESDSKQPQVILPNYLMARTNCLESSSLYALCCRDECEDLMGSLERNIGAAETTPERIVELVSVLPSDTVNASAAEPRSLSEPVLRRLDEVAAVNGGRVPIHGRLFAQWMHHVYPRECPYPHERGTTNAATADEWMRETGAESERATDAEMMKQVEEDFCAIGGSRDKGCGDDAEQSELPWSDSEELLGSVVAPQGSAATKVSRAATMLDSPSDPVLLRSAAAVGALVLLLVLATDARRVASRAIPDLEGGQNLGSIAGGASGFVAAARRILLGHAGPGRQAAALWAVGLGCFAVGLVDWVAFGSALLVGNAAVFARRAANTFFGKRCIPVKSSV